MAVHLHREMDKLIRAALEMCAHVEQNARDAARAFLDRDAELAKRVIDADRLVDRLELELSEGCLKLLALYQPVAGDLRFIFSLAKIAGILERVGDLAENLARKGKALAGFEDPVPIPPEFAEMADQARLMLKDSIDCLVNRDAAKAKEVIKADVEVNRRKRLIRRAGEAAIMANPQTCRQWLSVIAASRNVERMADMAANIASEVVYTVEGRMIRHGMDAE